jgi:hypothetical protein
MAFTWALAPKETEARCRRRQAQAQFTGAGLVQRLAEDLGLHRFAAEEALELSDLRLKLADAAGGDDIVVRPDRLETTFGHPSPPPEQKAGGNAVEPGDGRDRHAGPGRLLHQPHLLLGSVSPPALPAGDDFDAFDRLRHRRTPRLPPRSSRLRRMSGRNGVRSTDDGRFADLRRNGWARSKAPDVLAERVAAVAAVGHNPYRQTWQSGQQRYGQFHRAIRPASRGDRFRDVYEPLDR